MKLAFWITIAVLLIALVPLIIMGLWNWLMPYLFGVPTINFWQSCGIWVLASILFYKPSGK